MRSGLLLMAGVILQALAGGCAGHTRYSLSIDCLDFIAADEQSSTTIVTSDTGLTMYLLPGLQIDAEAKGPNKSSRRGLSVSTGTRDETPHAVRLVLEITGKMGLENVDEINSIPQGIWELRLAGADSRDVYSDGDIIATAAIPSLSPGEAAKAIVHAIVERENPSYEFIRSGHFRAGIRIHINPTATADVDLKYRITELRVSLSGFPFGYIP